jgi:ubiquitin C-terminal hydrolase
MVDLTAVARHKVPITIPRIYSRRCPADANATLVRDVKFRLKAICMVAGAGRVGGHFISVILKNGGFLVCDDSELSWVTSLNDVKDDADNQYVP